MKSIARTHMHGGYSKNLDLNGLKAGDRILRFD
jgi:hypothetical protein